MDQLQLQTPQWAIAHDSRSSVFSTLSSPSSSSRHTNGDLDLDSLFRRLDKYTAEMEEIEARLRQARSMSPDPTQSSLLRSSPLAFERPVEEKGARISISHSFSLSSETRNRGEGERVKTTSRPQSGGPGPDDSKSQSNFTPAGSAEALFKCENKSTPPRGVLEPEVNRAEDDLFHKKPSSKRGGMDFGIVQTRPWGSQHSMPDQRSSSPHPKEDFDLDNVLKRGPWFSGLTDLSDKDQVELAAPKVLSLPPRTSSRTLPIKLDVEASFTLPTSDSCKASAGPPGSNMKKGRGWSAHALSPLQPDLTPLRPPFHDSTSTLEISLPSTPLSPYSPREDQIRPELETSASHKARETRLFGYRNRTPLMLDLDTSQNDDGDEDEDEGRRKDNDWWRTGQQDRNATFFGTHDWRAVPSAKPRIRRQKSILGIFQRSPVEELIDMYFEG